MGNQRKHQTAKRQCLTLGNLGGPGSTVKVNGENLLSWRLQNILQLFSSRASQLSHLCHQPRKLIPIPSLCNPIYPNIEVDLDPFGNQMASVEQVVAKFCDLQLIALRGDVAQWRGPVTCLCVVLRRGLADQGGDI